MCGMSSDYLRGRGTPAKTPREGLAFLRAFNSCSLRIVLMISHVWQVVHASINQHKDCTWLLVAATETAGLYWDGDPVFGAYSCLRCPPRVDRRCGFVEWQGLDAVKEHIKKE
jgi:hypothetical protein